MKQTDILFPTLATSLIFLSAGAKCSIQEIDEAGVKLEEFERNHARDGKHNSACIRQRIALAKAYLRAGEKIKAELSFQKALGTARMFSPSIQTTQMLQTEWRLARETMES
ncbi:MAG: hypothetical protein KIT34_17970 [Cyanobacteria bacterium TGS_CYA1]|nr:hypothetical protein [Cyanobacteria bacterium TGS_CYA1]